MHGTRKTVLVTGATGKQGGAVARRLLENGHVVRALTRNAGSEAATRLKAMGAKVTEGDLENRSELERAVQGTNAIFAMSTPFEAGMQAEVAQGKSIADAAKSAGAHLVYTSVAWADRNTGIPHFDSKWEVEQYIQSLGISHSIVAPVYFMENLTTFTAEPLRLQHVIAVPLSPQVRQMQIAVADIASVAVLAIEQPSRLSGRRDIAGDALMGEDAARILTSVTGQEIHYAPVPLEAVRAQSEDLFLMFEYFERERPSVDIQALRTDFPEVRWHTFEQWVRAQDWRGFFQTASV